MLRGTMLLGKSSMRIGIKVSNRCSIIVLVSELEFNVPFQHKHGYIRHDIVFVFLCPSCSHEETVFWKKMLCSRNLILCRLAKCCDASMFALAAKYHIEPHGAVRSSVARIKDSFWFYFLN